ncbi:MAG: DUF47 family protein [Prevotellaceae bacterium]|jgi:predicted phosphate transport protein (TIGR00153 family)|nr:DUF47 family protein [Prevotellaceae bacterium]
MKLNSIFSFLLPKESTFFPLFKKSGALLVEAGDSLVEFIGTDDAEMRRIIYKRIKAAETNGDAVTNQLFDSLNDTFITPFDREDIRHLADALDDVLDYINGSAKRIVLYQPEKLPAQTAEMANIINQGCNEIYSAMLLLNSLNSKGEQLLKHCNAMKSLEQQADDLYEQFMLDVFTMEKNAIELIKLTQLMKELERTTNCVNAVAKVLKTLMIKYA